MEDLQCRFNQMFFHNQTFSKQHKTQKTGIVYLNTNQNKQINGFNGINNQHKIDNQEQIREFCCQFENYQNIFQYVQKHKKNIDIHTLYEKKDAIQKQNKKLQNQNEKCKEEVSQQIQDNINKIFRQIENKIWKNFLYTSDSKFLINQQDNTYDFKQESSIQLNYFEQNFQKIFQAEKIAIINFNSTSDYVQSKLNNTNKNVLKIQIYKEDSICQNEIKNTVTENTSAYDLKMPIMRDSTFYVGDSDFIYIFQRAIFPILKKYKPKFVFVTYDFKFLNKGYFGRQEITRDSFMYILYNIKAYITDKTCLLIQNHFEQSHWAILGLLSILRGDSFPNNFMIKKLTKKMFIKNMRPQSKFFEEAESIIELWSKSWKCLNKEKYIRIKNKVNKKLTIGQNFADGHWKRLKIENNLFCKVLSKGELYFYQNIYPKIKELQKYIPQVVKIKKNENGEMILQSQNLTYGKNCNQLDIKIAERYKQKYKYSPMWNQYHINLTGYIIKNEKGQTKEKLNGFYLFLEPINIIKIFDRFFENKSLKQKLTYIDRIIQIVQNLQQISEKYSVSFVSSSLLILFDSQTDNLQIKLIDFCHTKQYKNQCESLSIGGLKRFFYDLKNFYLENKTEQINQILLFQSKSLSNFKKITISAYTIFFLLINIKLQKNQHQNFCIYKQANFLLSPSFKNQFIKYKQVMEYEIHLMINSLSIVAIILILFMHFIQIGVKKNNQMYI